MIVPVCFRLVVLICRRFFNGRDIYRMSQILAFNFWDWRPLNKSTRVDCSLLRLLCGTRASLPWSRSMACFVVVVCCTAVVYAALSLTCLSRPIALFTSEIHTCSYNRYGVLRIVWYVRAIRKTCWVGSSQEICRGTLIIRTYFFFFFFFSFSFFLFSFFNPPKADG